METLPIPGHPVTSDASPQWLAGATQAFLVAAYQFVDRRPEEWALEYNADLEVTNHVLRVRIQDGTIAAHAPLVQQLCAHQHDDGGWGNRRDDPNTQLRSTAFCTQMLLRANRSLHSDVVQRSVERALRHIVGAQLKDGSWRDSRWHLLDATSVSVGTLLFAAREPFARPTHREALGRGMQFVQASRAPTCLWYYKPTASPVTISAHLLQKCVTYELPAAFVLPSAHALLDLQSPEGHWDKGNVDHTCDAIRCLLLCASQVDDVALKERVIEASRLALAWIIGTATDGGLGDRPGRRPHVERTCDGIDTALKVRQFFAARHDLVHFWR